MRDGRGDGARIAVVVVVDGGVDDGIVDGSASFARAGPRHVIITGRVRRRCGNVIGGGGGADVGIVQDAGPEMGGPLFPSRAFCISTYPQCIIWAKVASSGASASRPSCRDEGVQEIACGLCFFWGGQTRISPKSVHKRWMIYLRVRRKKKKRRFFTGNFSDEAKELFQVPRRTAQGQKGRRHRHRPLTTE